MVNCCKWLKQHKDFVLYAVFMTIFSIVSWMDRGDATAYYMNKLMKDDLLTTTWSTSPGSMDYVYKTWEDIANVGELYQFIDQVFLPFAMQEEYENGDKIPADHLYYTHNCKVLGVRLRTVRVKANVCTDTGLGEYVSKPCFAEFDVDVQETASYGNVTGDQSFLWQEEDDQWENSYWGKLDIYPGGGYFIDLPMNQSSARTIVNHIRANAFIDDATRAFFLDFQLYNEPHNLHMVCRCVVEFPHGGGAKPKATFNVLKINSYNDSLGKLQMALEFIIGLFIIYFLCEELWEMKQIGLKPYLKNAWNVVDMINIIIFAFVGTMRMYFYNSLEHLDPISYGPDYVSLQLRVNAFAIESALMSVNAWFLWFKLLKFMSGNPKVAFLTKTFIIAASELLFFFMIFFFLMVGFGHAGYIVFSETSVQFRSFEISFVSIFLATMAGLDADEIGADNVVAGPLFVFLFELSMIVILVNVFLAIINSAYDEVTAESKDIPEPKTVSFASSMKYWCSVKCCKGKNESQVIPVVARSDDSVLLKKAIATSDKDKDDKKNEVTSKQDKVFQAKMKELKVLESKLHKILQTVTATNELLSLE